MPQGQVWFFLTLLDAAILPAASHQNNRVPRRGEQACVL